MLRSSSASATARASAAKLVLDRSPSASAEFVRRAIYAKQEAQRQAELPGRTGEARALDRIARKRAG
jgi:hypothetical protein